MAFGHLVVRQIIIWPNVATQLYDIIYATIFGKKFAKIGAKYAPKTLQ
jgi:hypothetical protein